MISGVSGFSVFAIKHIRKDGNHGKFSEAQFSRYWIYLSDFEHVPKHFVRSRQNSQGVAQSCQEAPTIEAWNWVFLLLKPKWYVDNELIAFEQFCCNGKAFTLGAFWFRKVCVDLRHFRVFAFCHRAYSKTRKPREIFRSSVFEVSSLIICFEHFAKYFVCSRQNSQGVTQSYQGALTIEAWNWLFLLLRPKWYVDNKLIAF